MKFKPILMYFVIALLPLSAYSDLAQIQQQLNIAPLFQCEFEQTRQLKDMQLNLQSKGELVLAQPKGLIWQQTAPFPQTMVMTEKQIYQSVLGNVQIISATEQPQLFHFTQLIRDVLQGQWQRLTHYFQMEEVKTNTSQWQVVLRPSRAPFQSIFKHIILTGDSRIQSVRIQDQQGDSTELHFKNCKALKSLTHEQDTLFAQ
ncbi:LolA family protein [Pasteurella sp. PK-2025]|uniref:LolA family protein n=1 Tax=Pasteurella sp. PK-2025 TaxID=3413133 RepID=UPI003C734D0C